MNGRVSGWRLRASQHLDWLFIRLLCLDPRLMAAYQVTLAEIAAARRPRRALQDDGEVSDADARQAAAGAIA